MADPITILAGLAFVAVLVAAARIANHSKGNYAQRIPQE